MFEGLGATKLDALVNPPAYGRRRRWVVLLPKLSTKS
jgi:hypothetical protein